MSRFNCALVLAVIAIGAIPARAEERFKDSTHGFSVELPDHWVSVSPDVVTQINSAVAMFLKQKITYVGCLVPKGHTSAELPRILIQFQPWDGGAPTYDAIEESLKHDLKGAVKQVKKKAGVQIGSLELGETTLDRSANRLIMRMQASVAGDGMVQGLSIGMLGKEGVIFLHCYANQERFGRMIPVFEVFADSFQFAAGKAYDPAEATVTSISRPESSHKFSFSWFGASRGGFLGAIVGGGIGVLAVAARILRRRVV